MSSSSTLTRIRIHSALPKRGNSRQQRGWLLAAAAGWSSRAHQRQGCCAPYLLNCTVRWPHHFPSFFLLTCCCCWGCLGERPAEFPSRRLLLSADCSQLLAARRWLERDAAKVDGCEFISRAQKFCWAKEGNLPKVRIMRRRQL